MFMDLDFDKFSVLPFLASDNLAAVTSNIC